MINFTLSVNHRLYWISLEANTFLGLQGAGIPVIDIGQSVAERFQSAKETTWLGNEVETWLTNELRRAAVTWPDLPTPLVAVSNPGILLEPNLALNPALWLKRMTKELTIMLLWAGQFQPPGLFYWNSPDKYVLTLSDAAPQPLIITQ